MKNEALIPKCSFHFLRTVADDISTSAATTGPQQPRSALQLQQTTATAAHNDSTHSSPRRQHSQQQLAAPSSSNIHQPFTATHSPSASTPRLQLRCAFTSRPTQPSIVSICRRCSCSDLRDQGLSCLADGDAVSC
ncbi:hypothetical protein WN944_001120 [Citrus x changshan-huyou]|uniref:Uncharacterized protein n=1 Tax=Citrus x changshan-huyou TaxID=2935761 RepID=A0AAP0MFX0_9ROSI